MGAHKPVVVWCQTLAAPESLFKAVFEPCGELEFLHHISVTPELVTLNSGYERCLVPVEVTKMLNERVTLPPNTALASVHLATTVFDGFNRNDTPADREVIFSAPKVDTTEIDCNETELTEGQRAKVKGMLAHVLCFCK